MRTPLQRSELQLLVNGFDASPCARVVFGTAGRSRYADSSENRTGDFDHHPSPEYDDVGQIA
jgi:hypothetical protein